MIFKQNNLSAAISPYLQQHKDNTIWWQEWSGAVLEHARAENKIIFASIGYSTCHWCHVMAQEAFNDDEVAEYLNAHFVSIKVDREQRPDIDQYAMAFINSLGGQGGWPLNIFFTPSLRPIYALTYASVGSRYGGPSFIDILAQVDKFYSEKKDRIEPFVFGVTNFSERKNGHFINAFWNAFDQEHAGFGIGAKFPPHCTMLFMLYYLGITGSGELREMVVHTMDKMLSGGLHDHLQGGFFRYCVDREWVIPHFEKMLYDQALLLWEYSLAYHVTKKTEYKNAALKIVRCLEETFENDSLYKSGHDADTDHEEGAAYLWTEAEVSGILTEEELKRFKEVYAITGEGNFDGKNHLVRKNLIDVGDIEDKLLETRKKRRQPFVDGKIITSWNCLVGIGLIHAYRYLGDESFLAKAEKIFGKLRSINCRDGKVYHSSIGSHVQQEGFLQDTAAMLLFTTYLHEETGAYTDEMNESYSDVKERKMNTGWVESSHPDFISVPAEVYDSPSPSSVSMAELGILRADILCGREYGPGEFSEPVARDFFNIAVLMRKGLFHVIEAPENAAFSGLPSNSIQIRGKERRDCYLHACVPKFEPGLNEGRG